MSDDLQTAIDLCSDIMFNGYDYSDVLEAFETIRADERKKCADAVKAIQWYVPLSNDTRMRSGYSISGKEIKDLAVSAIMARGE